MPLVVMQVDAPSPVSLAEGHQHRGEVVRKVAVIDAAPAQRVPHDHIEEEMVGRHQDRPDREEPLGELWIVEQDVGTLALQPTLERAPAHCRPATEKQEHQVKVGGAEAAPGVRSNHRFPAGTGERQTSRSICERRAKRAVDAGGGGGMAERTTGVYRSALINPASA
jgi:hypothetical protein